MTKRNTIKCIEAQTTEWLSVKQTIIVILYNYYNNQDLAKQKVLLLTIKKFHFSEQNKRRSRNLSVP